MEKRNICIIDNDFPAKVYSVLDKTDIIRSEMLSLMVEKERWDDEALKSLTAELLRMDGWEVSAALHADRFLSASEKQSYAAEIIVFDWDCGGPGGSEQQKRLYEVLDKTYSLLIIYSNVPDLTLESVKRNVGEEKFGKYANRVLQVLKKGEEGSLEAVLDKAKTANESNFSLKFGADLRRKVHRSLEELLVGFGRFSEKELVAYLGEADGEEKTLSENELVELIASKLKSSLSSQESKFPDLKLPKADVDANAKKELLEELWSYRVYYFPKDNVVRKGDIVRETAGFDKLWLIVTSDCHMRNLANKNLGILTLVPLYKISGSNETLKTKLKAIKAETRKHATASSMVNVKQFERTAILSSIKTDTGYCDYMLMPYEATNMDLAGVVSPTLADLQSRGYQRCCSVSEPFLTPLINHILTSITSYGAADYPQILRDSINAKFKEINDALR